MVPIGLIMRAVGREDPLRRRFDQKAPSYWITREPKNSSAIDMKNQF
jgi:hypothetical protein